MHLNPTLLKYEFALGNEFWGNPFWTAVVELQQSPVTGACHKGLGWSTESGKTPHKKCV